MTNNKNATPEIDTGDTIRHVPSGESWLVAYVENGRLCACGWPCSLVPLKDCELVEKASPEARIELLGDMASIHGDDPRKSYAQRVLATREAEPASVVDGRLASGHQESIQDSVSGGLVGSVPAVGADVRGDRAIVGNNANDALPHATPTPPPGHGVVETIFPADDFVHARSIGVHAVEFKPAAPVGGQAVALTDAERTELLDWVSACQSQYHIDSTPNHRFVGLGSNLEENRTSLVDYVEGLLAARALAASPAPAQPAQYRPGEWVEVSPGHFERYPAPSQPVAAPRAAQEVPSTEAYDQSLYLDVINYGYARRDGDANTAASWMRQIIRRIEAMSISAPAAPTQANTVASDVHAALRDAGLMLLKTERGYRVEKSVNFVAQSAAPTQSAKDASVSLIGAHDAHPALVRMPTSFAWPADIAAQSAAPQQSTPTQSDAAEGGT